MSLAPGSRYEPQVTESPAILTQIQTNSMTRKRMKGLAEFVFQKKQSEPRLAVNHKYLLRDKISLHWSTLNAIKLNK